MLAKCCAPVGAHARDVVHERVALGPRLGGRDEGAVDGGHSAQLQVADAAAADVGTVVVGSVAGTQADAAAIAVGLAAPNAARQALVRYIAMAIAAQVAGIAGGAGTAVAQAEDLNPWVEHEDEPAAAQPQVLRWSLGLPSRCPQRASALPLALASPLSLPPRSPQVAGAAGVQQAATAPWLAAAWQNRPRSSPQTASLALHASQVLNVSENGAAVVTAVGNACPLLSNAMWCVASSPASAIGIVAASAGRIEAANADGIVVLSAGGIGAAIVAASACRIAAASAHGIAAVSVDVSTASHSDAKLVGSVAANVASTAALTDAWNAV